MTAVLVAAIPYRTFPTVSLGPVGLRTFGLTVALGAVAGIAVAARLMPPEVDRDDVARLGTRMVLAGIVAARLTWVVTHFDELGGPVDVIAVWQGGLQFSGGFLGALAVGLPALRRWPGPLRWQVADRLVLGLAVGMAIGRIGCYAVGEHLGRPTGFLLGTRYLGGPTREGPPRIGQVVHNTALYEILQLTVLAVVLWWLIVRARTRVAPGRATALACLWYGAARLATDTLRAYDDRVAGLTGAQWMSAGLVAVGLAAQIERRRRRVSRAETGRLE